MTQYEAITPDILDELRPFLVTVSSSVKKSILTTHMMICPSTALPMPEVTIDVTSTEEVSAIMKVCARHHIPVTVRGAGTGLVGGCTPVQGGVVLCTMRMNKILGYDEENMNVRVEAGVLLADLAKDAESRGFFYPPDPGEKFATLGGNVSTTPAGCGPSSTERRGTT